ncbi:endopeptidase La [Candidatus Chromulinivorax destructor]|uniref:Lon protease n=1 Tax=Candidatus Chromulinivorax destructor TaxID=2066483 RepID=A0A345ZCJ8_9BACT|nr:endopeptidase La [Candidatus Chromulinivorax destructor]AXK61015.1 endopeptidase La [Candidatus Chromulinivorax destructor]
MNSEKDIITTFAKDSEFNNASTDTTIEDLPLTLPVLPLKNIVTLPSSIVPVIVGRKSSINAVEYAMKHNNKTIFVTSQKHPDTEDPKLDDLFEYGTVSSILQIIKMPNGSLKILIEGIHRAKIASMAPQSDFLQANFEYIPTVHSSSNSEMEAAWRQLDLVYQSYIKVNTKIPTDLTVMTRSFTDKDSVVDTIAVHANLSFLDRQKILETPELTTRMINLTVLLKNEIDILDVEQRIKCRIQDQVEKNQREYYLTEQIKAIHKELGKEDQMEEVNELRLQLKALKLPAHLVEKTDKELSRLEQMPAMSAESSVSKNYLDWIINLPWHKISKDSISLKQAETILNKQHAGLKKVKDRIIEFIAAKKFAKNLTRSPIICLVGAPGVGKTSLASSIAASLGREFVRISLGGVRDEAEIRGHRRTYIGAMPGKIIQAMRKAKTVNPVILLDEIDKMARDHAGDPSAALLEVLDPEQNKSFIDHFVDAEYDLSQVMFIATANMIEMIPYPLYDRMEIISLAGYTEKDKLFIANKFLIPKHLKEHNVPKKQFKINDATLLLVINEYTQEAGVRQLERVVTKLIRKAIQELLNGDLEKVVTVTPALIQTWLGYPKFKKTNLNIGNRVGIATGLAWTEMGGDVLEIEVALLPGKGNFTLTGQLGEVMQESAQAAFSYIKANATRLKIPQTMFNNKDIHIHLPEGATPKDGPSAGISMCCAMVSALTGVPLKPHLAMTGEITLRGRVLGVGGLKEKLLAAQQYQMTDVILPYPNEDDIKEFAHEIENVNLFFAKDMDEVLERALEENPFTRKVAKEKVEKKKSVEKTSAPKKKKTVTASN